LSGDGDGRKQQLLMLLLLKENVPSILKLLTENRRGCMLHAAEWGTAEI